MNADQFKGRWTQFKGEFKKQWGNFTDDDLLQIEGDYQKFQGKLQAKYGDRKRRGESLGRSMVRTPKH
jgi:uncharacterized protein YjbJ (UPF0337 family)